MSRTKHTRLLLGVVVVSLFLGVQLFLRSARTDGQQDALSSGPGQSAIASPVVGAVTSLAAVPNDGADPDQAVPIQGVKARGQRSATAQGLEEPGPQALTVRVVDESGAPIGRVMVTLESEDGALLFGRETETRDGTVEFPAAAFEADTGARLQVEGMRVRADVLLERAVEADLKATDLNGAPVELVVPSHGQVRVLLSEVDGGSFTSQGTVSIGLVRDDEALETGLLSTRRKTILSVPIVEGQAFFPVVGLGQLLEIKASRSGSDIDTECLVDGPVFANPSLELPLRWGSDHPVLRFHVLDQGGTKLSNTPVNSSVSTDLLGIPVETSSTGTSDEAGLVQVDVSKNWVEGTSRTLTVVAWGDEYERSRGWLLRAASSMEQGLGDESDGSVEPAALQELRGGADLSLALGSGLNVIDDIYLAAPQLFVQGMVVDIDGQGVEGAKLELEALVPVGTNGPPRWRRTGGFMLLSGRAGLFRSTASPPGQRYRLTVKASGLIGETVEFLPGQDGLMLMLQVGGTVTGRVLVEEGIPMELLRYELRPTPVPESETLPRSIRAQRQQNTLGEDGILEATGLGAGTYRLRVRSRFGSKILFETKDLDVSLGETTRDPLLDPIDLRGMLFVHDVTVVTPKGADFTPGNLYLGLAGSGALGELRWLSEPQKTFLSTQEHVDVEFRCPGYRTTRAFDQTRRIELKLQPGPQVRLRIDGDYEVPQAPFSVKALLAPTGSGASSNADGQVLDERREVLIIAPDAGSCDVHWMVFREGANTAIGSLVDSLGHRVEVADTLDEQVLSIVLTQAELDQILKVLD